MEHRGHLSARSRPRLAAGLVAGLAGVLVAAGVVGAGLGIALGKRLAAHKRAMEVGFAGVVVVVGVYVVWGTLG